MLHIWVDADACPVKDEIYKVAKRYKMSVTLVANSYMRVPESGSVTLEVVGSAADEADDWIADHVQKHDIVITSDVPLASRCVKAGATVLGSTGRVFDDDNIGDALAMRDLLTELRSGGETTRGPAPMQAKDRSRFLQKLDQVIQAIRRKAPPKSP